MSADKLASFRVETELWEQFQGHAKSQNSTATALLISYIKSVVNTGSVITSNPIINTSAEVNNPSLSIQDIDTRIDEKIKQSIQNINTLSIQDIDNCIDCSLVDGKIKEAIASSYAGVMGQFNGLLDELQDLKKQMEALKSILPTAASSQNNEQLTTDNGQFTKEIECDRTDSDAKSESQIIPDPNKNQIENIRTTLKRKGIQSVSNDQIRNAFYNAGWDGQNYKELRQAVIDLLSKAP